ncbi:hemerythrin domain-containing protein [Bacillus sp. EB600]|uniref:hemerythrin domain-containing protein n=1 Tax=Bacillus sp. EB600 TaxID=2806345 RepID=UPI00210E7BF5|nr:hemerythrin domain-containing protein [Bacillus sp. EB600]MCQ6282061.1 hemerythrin domain-containing protein [Bacillus sp. EB600]
MSNSMNALRNIQSVELCAGLTRLKEEHVPLLEKIDSILLLSEQIENEEDSHKSFADLKNLVELFQLELKPHSQREEEGLFQLLGIYIGTTSGPVVVNTDEHKQARALLGAFLEKAGNDKLTLREIKESIEGIRSAANLLKNHFAKEENILFPKAESLLSEQEKAELYSKMQEIN